MKLNYWTLPAHYEVFSVTAFLDPSLDLQVKTVAFKEDIKVNKSGLMVKPHELVEAKDADLFIIPGGIGTRQILQDEITLHKIDELIKKSKIVASICTGALILAKLGHLKDLPATTHHMGFERLSELDSTIEADPSKRFIDCGHILTSAGISAGIDMSLHLVENNFGTELKDKVTGYMEYGNS